jgi:hypothetical protein
LKIDLSKLFGAPTRLNWLRWNVMSSWSRMAARRWA